MRINLQVPFAEKDDAKRLGARWDPVRKVWYVENRDDMTPFQKWMHGDLHKAAGGTAAASQPKAGTEKTMTQPRMSAPTLVVGSNYVECPRVCDCLPWEECEKCASMAIRAAAG